MLDVITSLMVPPPMAVIMPRTLAPKKSMPRCDTASTAVMAKAQVAASPTQ